MREITFSVMGQVAEHLQPLLDEFEETHHIHVRLQPLDWDTGWDTLLKVALYGRGPDVSELGSTWVGDFIKMDVLRPFEEDEIGRLGGIGAHIHPGEHDWMRSSGTLKWAIPWLTGARMLFYRSDLLEKNGVAAQIDTPEALYTTLERIQQAGVAVPWTVPTDLTHTTVLNAASWIWAQGGDFIAADGKRTLFTQPEAMEGFRQYFSLARFIPESARHLAGLQTDDLFLHNPQVGATPSGAWLYLQAQAQWPADQLARLRFTPPPGGSFRGGSYLAIWQNCMHPQEAVRLVEFLDRPENQAAYAVKLGLTPARRSAFELEPFSSSPFWRSVNDALQNNSRSFPIVRSWGLLEDRLCGALHRVWQDLLKDPEQEVTPLLEQHLLPLARMIDISLANQ